MKKRASQHAWLAEVLKDIDAYVRENELWSMSLAVSQAYLAARAEFEVDILAESRVIAFAHRVAGSLDSEGLNVRNLQPRSNSQFQPD